MFEHELGGLEALGQLDFDCLRDGPRAGEADQGARFRDDDVAQHGEAGGDAAGGGVGQDGDEQALCVVEPGHGGGGLGHLAERDDALVHAGPAGAAHDDQGKRFFDGLIHGDTELFAHDGAHRAHEEIGLHDAQDDAAALDKRLADENGLFQTGLFLVVLDPLFVGCAAIFEVERVVGGQILKHLLKRAFVREVFDAG